MNLLKNIFFISVFVSTILIFPSCAKYSPKPIVLKNVVIQEHDNVQAFAYQLSPEECKSRFDSKDLAKHLTAIQLGISNKSQLPLILDANNISVPVAKNTDVKNLIYRWTGCRIAGYSIAAMPLVAFQSFLAVGLCFMVNPLTSIIFSTVTILPFFTPAVVDGIKSKKANHQIDLDFAENVLGWNESTIITPNHNINKFIFIQSNDFSTKLHITLVNEQGMAYTTFIFPINNSAKFPC